MSITNIAGTGLVIDLDSYTPQSPNPVAPEFWHLQTQLKLQEWFKPFLPKMVHNMESNQVTASLVENSKELLSHSSELSINNVPLEDLAKLEQLIVELRTRITRGEVDADTRKLIDSFSLPDPKTAPELYRVFGPPEHLRLAILWGMSKNGSASIPLKDFNVTRILKDYFSPDTAKAKRAKWPWILLLIAASGVMYYAFSGSTSTTSPDSGMESPVIVGTPQAPVDSPMTPANFVQPNGEQAGIQVAGPDGQPATIMTDTTEPVHLVGGDGETVEIPPGSTVNAGPEGLLTMIGKDGMETPVFVQTPIGQPANATVIGQNQPGNAAPTALLKPVRVPGSKAPVKVIDAAGDTNILLAPAVEDIVLVDEVRKQIPITEDTVLKVGPNGTLTLVDTTTGTEKPVFVVPAKGDKPVEPVLAKQEGSKVVTTPLPSNGEITAPATAAETTATENVITTATPVPSQLTPAVVKGKDGKEIKPQITDTEGNEAHLSTTKDEPVTLQTTTGTILPQDTPVQTHEGGWLSAIINGIEEFIFPKDNNGNPAETYITTTNVVDGTKKTTPVLAPVQTTDGKKPVKVIGPKGEQNILLAPVGETVRFVDATGKDVSVTETTELKVDSDGTISAQDKETGVETTVSTVTTEGKPVKTILAKQEGSKVVTTPLPPNGGITAPATAAETPVSEEVVTTVTSVPSRLTPAVVKGKDGKEIKPQITDTKGNKANLSATKDEPVTLQTTTGTILPQDTPVQTHEGGWLSAIINGIEEFIFPKDNNGNPAETYITTEEVDGTKKTTPVLAPAHTQGSKKPVEPTDSEGAKNTLLTPAGQDVRFVDETGKDVSVTETTKLKVGSDETLSVQDPVTGAETKVSPVTMGGDPVETRLVKKTPTKVETRIVRSFRVTLVTRNSPYTVNKQAEETLENGKVKTTFAIRPVGGAKLSSATLHGQKVDLSTGIITVELDPATTKWIKVEVTTEDGRSYANTHDIKFEQQ